MAILDKYGLPRKKSESLLNIFPAGGLVPSESQQKIRYQAGLAQQIASVIRKFNGVLDSDVVISFPETNPLNPSENLGKITASVWVKHNGVLDDPNSHLREKIKRLVSSSVPGLNYDDVTVVGDLAHLPSVSSVSTLQKPGEEKQEYVKVWGMIVAKDSLRKFQILFFSFCILILLLALVSFWVIWKIIPVIRKRGGIKAFFHLSPLHDEHTEPAKEEKKEDGKDDKDDKGPKDSGGASPSAAAGAGPKVQENVESQ
jgi:type III secretion protein J